MQKPGYLQTSWDQGSTSKAAEMSMQKLNIEATVGKAEDQHALHVINMKLVTNVMVRAASEHYK